jgi:hypothetical protein
MSTTLTEEPTPVRAAARPYRRRPGRAERALYSAGIGALTLHLLDTAPGPRPRSPASPRANDIYRAAAGPTARLWRIPEAAHTGGLDARPEKYEQRTIGFLARALPHGREAGAAG